MFSSDMTDDCFSRKLAQKEPLTTIIGINCKDGIVLFSDSQESLSFKGAWGVKRTIAKKINEIGNNGLYLIGGAGASEDLEQLVEFLNKEFASQKVYYEEDLHNLIERKFKKFLNKHNVILPKKTHGYPVADSIDVEILFGAKIMADSGRPIHVMYKILTKNRLSIRHVYEYGSAGTGSIIVNPLLDYLNKWLKQLDYTWHDISIDLAKKICDLIFDIVLKTDLATGGEKICRIIDQKNGVISTKETQVWERPNESHIAQTLQLAYDELENIRPQISKILANLHLQKGKK